MSEEKNTKASKKELNLKVSDFVHKKNLIFALIVAAISGILGLLEFIPFLAFFVGILVYSLVFFASFVFVYVIGYESNQSKLIETIKSILLVGILSGSVYGIVSSIIPRSYVFLGVSYPFSYPLFATLISNAFWSLITSLAGSILAVYLDKKYIPKSLLDLISKIKEKYLQILK